MMQSKNNPFLLVKTNSMNKIDEILNLLNNKEEILNNEINALENEKKKLDDKMEKLNNEIKNLNKKEKTIHNEVLEGKISNEVTTMLLGPTEDNQRKIKSTDEEIKYT